MYIYSLKADHPLKDVMLTKLMVEKRFMCRFDKIR